MAYWMHVDFNKHHEVSLALLGTFTKTSGKKYEQGSNPKPILENKQIQKLTIILIGNVILSFDLTGHFATFMKIQGVSNYVRH